jgi:hypothetical protein
MFPRNASLGVSSDCLGSSSRRKRVESCKERDFVEICRILVESFAPVTRNFAVVGLSNCFFLVTRDPPCGIE